MARLPTPVTETLNVEWPVEEEWAKMGKNFFSILGHSVRKAVNAEKLKTEEKEKKD